MLVAPGNYLRLSNVRERQGSPSGAVIREAYQVIGEKLSEAQLSRMVIGVIHKLDQRRPLGCNERSAVSTKSCFLLPSIFC